MKTNIEMRKLGQHGTLVSKFGLGGVAMSDLYGHDRNDEESAATLHAAIDAGITLLDTGDFYGSGHNELLIGTAVRQRKRDELTISVRFGSRRDPAGGWQPVGSDTTYPGCQLEVAFSSVEIP